MILKSTIRYLFMGLITYIIVGYIDYETTSFGQLFGPANIGFAVLFSLSMAVIYFALHALYKWLTGLFRS